MIPPKGAPTFRDYLQILGRGWLVVVAATALSAGLGWVSWEFGKATYTSTSRVIISSIGDASSLDAFYGVANAESRVTTWTFLARSERVTGPTIDQLGLGETTASLAGRISILPSATPVLDIVVKGTDPEETRRTADAVTNNLVALSKQLVKVDGSSTDLVLVDGAGPAKRDGSLKSTLIKATSVGLVVSLVLVLALGLSLNRVLGRRQLERVVQDAGVPE